MGLIKLRLFLLIASTLILSSLFAPTSYANNSWGGYHWARTNNPFTLKLGDNLSLNWKSYLRTTSSDWSQSVVFDTTVVPGATTSRRCRPTSGRVEVCNYRYGKNGWLGLAQIWVSGNHLTQGVTKLNDTYFATAQYNTSQWRNLVLCQEVGHNLGVDHQDENFGNLNLGTCMDYTDDPSGLLKGQPNNEHPNAHDFDELLIIYQHLDGLTTIQNNTQKLLFNVPKAKEILNGDFENRSEWGSEIRKNRRAALYERNFGAGYKLFTFIILTED